MNPEDNLYYEGIETIPLSKPMALPKKTNSELMLFLGAGASVANIPGVEIKNALLQNITEVEVNELKTKISVF